MIKSEMASISVRKIILLSLALMFLLGVGVIASGTNINSVKIILSNNYELNVLTNKTKVEDILEESHIVVLPEENVVPDLESDISETKKIVISKTLQEGITAIKLSQEDAKVSMEQLLGDYTPVVERIIVEQVPIPFETITKDVSGGSQNTINKVITEGKDGVKEVTAKVKYQNDIEIDRTIINEVVITEPINKIVQVDKSSVTSRSQTSRVANISLPTTTTNSSSIAKSVAGKTPVVRKFNTSAYCSCAKCCGKTNGITSSGKKATTWCTVAAGNAYPIGTVIYIPALKNKPNGGWFIVQDRGGAISNGKLDIYMGTHNQALQFGRKTLECYVYM